MARDHDSTHELNRRTVLQKTGAVAAGAGAFSIGASAKGNGKAKGKQKDEADKNGNGPGKNKGGAGANGPPFLEPTHDGIVFCGCSQVCVCVLPGDCETGKVRLENGDCVDISEGECYWGENIVAVESQTADETVRVCNPNTACSGNVASECDEVGTAPQFGEKCGEAFLAEHGH